MLIHFLIDVDKVDVITEIISIVIDSESIYERCIDINLYLIH